MQEGAEVGPPSYQRAVAEPFLPKPVDTTDSKDVTIELTPTTVDTEGNTTVVNNHQDNSTFLESFLERVPRPGFTENMSDNQCCLMIVGGIVGVAAILILILVPMSFVGLEYYEMGFRRSKSTGSVDVDNVYEFGKHFIGPDGEFKVFPASAVFESFDRITVFSGDRLEMEISCNLQYFLRPHQLKQLHKSYDIAYRPVLRNNALDALKGRMDFFHLHTDVLINKCLPM